MFQSSLPDAERTHLNDRGPGEYRGELGYLREVLQEGTMVLEGESIVHANPQMCRLTGYTEDELIGKSFLNEIIIPEDREILHQKILRGTEQGCRLRILRKNGARITVGAVCQDIMIVGREMRVVYFRDQDVVLDLESGLRKNSQLAITGRMASGVAHEITSPLSTISTINEVLLARLPVLKDQVKERGSGENIVDVFEEYLKITLEESIRAGKIIRDLLDFARIRDYQFSALDMEELITSTVRIMRVQSRLGKYDLNIHIEPDLPSVDADRDRIRQVLIILISNAAESMPGGGPIRIDSGHLAEENGITISVRDSGEGLKDADAERIFEPFFTTKVNSGGTGLGLSVADTIVRKHGGWIRAKANDDIGMTFQVFLPIGGEKQTEGTFL